jgi:Predicted pPIWI-associating nuclease
MPVTISDLTARGAIKSEYISNETDSNLEVYRSSFAAQRNRALDILKNSAVQTAALNALDWPSLKAASGLNELFTSPALEARRALSRLAGPLALEYARHVQEVFGSAQFAEQFSAYSAKILAAQDFTRLADISRLVSSQFSALNDSIASATLRRAALFGVRGWESAATAFVGQPDAKRLLPLEAFGRGTVGVTSAVTALLPDLDGIATNDDRALLGPALFAEALRESLSSLDRRLPRRLEGAWERVSRRGPDAASQAAHSLMETIDWTLKLAAPESTVLAWHEAEGRPGGELCNGRPTRALRVAWLLRGRPGEADAARLHLRALNDLVSAIQSYKHSADEADIEAVARLILTVEGLLIFVLGISPADD